MKTITTLMLVCMFALALCSVAMAQESTKTAIGWSGTQIVSATIASSPNPWATVLAGWLKTGTPKDIGVMFTAESMLATYVKVQTTKSATGEIVADTDSSEAAIQIRCLIDGKEAFPGPVTFDSRLMKLSARLGEAIVTDPTGILVSAGDQWISIYERTKQCHAFNFAYTDLGSGDHLVEIQAKVALSPSPREAFPENTDAILGTRMMICDEINLKTRLFPQ